MKPHRLAAATAALALIGSGAALAVAAPAAAHARGPALQPTPHVLASGLAGPLRAAVARDGTAYVSENNAGRIDRISPDGTMQTVYTDPAGNEVGGLSLAGPFLFFTVTSHDPNDPETNLDSWLEVLSPSGTVHQVVDLHQYEAAANPDQINQYGFDDLAPDCASQWPAENGPSSYAGVPDSHPYATYALRNGWVYVADAGGNDVLLVSPSGDVHTVAVLPPIPYTITADAATGLQLPDCFVGATYGFEPVPTDIERGPDGRLYVTSLPGGPEGDQLGARGSVFVIGGAHGRSHEGHHGYRRARSAARSGNTDYGRPRSVVSHCRHHGAYGARMVVSGLLGPTGLAFAPHGTLYVTQLFGDEISRVTFSRQGTHLSALPTSTPSPAEVEWGPGGLYYTTDALSEQGGQLIRYGD